jgi:TolB-like protein/cytochrome c-type biogenesis protein CcmH/NrfG
MGYAMTPQEFERKLSAILSADVAEYSRLMGEDEDLTICAVSSNREMMGTLIKQYKGRVVDSPGDNLLAEFSSVTQAVNCAVEIQRELAERNSELSENRRMDYRIGVNVGDVAQEGDRIYGDGVNIAARLESLAEPGGICISGFVYNQVKNRLKLEYEYLGEQSVKNIKEPVPVYRVLSFPGAAAHRVIEAKKAVDDKMAAPAFQDKPSIAVLPFVNLSNDPEQEFFSDGMSEEIIGALAKLEGLKVISRTSAFHFKGKDIDLHTIGEKLKVAHVLEGSVRKAGSKIRISAQLIKVSDDTHLWAETYDRELEDVFAIQDEISQAVVQSLKVKLLGTKTEPLVKDYTKSTEAYELFLKGLYFQGKGISSEWKKAIEYYERAIKVDPDFAPAYSKLAVIYRHNAIVFSQPSKEMWSKVKKWVLKALDIDEMEAEAHSFMGIIKLCSEYDWLGAETYFKRAIELNPGNSAVHEQYATYLIGVGRFNEAIEKMKRALELDPFSMLLNAFMAFPFYFARQFEKAIAQAQKALELAPHNPSALQILGMSHAAKGMYDEGITILQRVSNIPLITAQLGCLYGMAGKREEAYKILDDFLERSNRDYFSPFMIAIVFSGLGEKDKVFEWLDKAFEERDAINHFIKVEPTFDNLHSDPRWIKLMGKMGLAD